MPDDSRQVNPVADQPTRQVSALWNRIFPGDQCQRGTHSKRRFGQVHPIGGFGHLVHGCQAAILVNPACL